MKDIGLDDEKYMNERVSLRKVWLIFVSNIWIFVLALLIGALAGAGIYAAYRQALDGTQYKAVSKLYVTFGTDDKEDAYQAYNGYTWNDLLTTDPVCGLIDEEFENNGVEFDTGTKEAVRKYVKAEILSDIRVLTVTVTFGDADTADRMLSAVDKALERFGDEQPEISSVKTIEEDNSELVVSDSRMKQAAGLGAVIAAIVCLFVMWIVFAVSDRVYLPEDVRRRTGLPLMGISFRKEDGTLLAKVCGLYGLASSACTGVGVNSDKACGAAGGEEAREADSGANVENDNGVIYLRYRQDRVFIAEEKAAGMKARGITPAGFVITDCDNRFYKRYFIADFIAYGKNTGSVKNV